MYNICTYNYEQKKSLSTYYIALLHRYDGLACGFLCNNNHPQIIVDPPKCYSLGQSGRKIEVLEPQMSIAFLSRGGILTFWLRNSK